MRVPVYVDVRGVVGVEGFSTPRPRGIITDTHTHPLPTMKLNRTQGIVPNALWVVMRSTGNRYYFSSFLYRCAFVFFWAFCRWIYLYVCMCFCAYLCVDACSCSIDLHLCVFVPLWMYVLAMCLDIHAST